MTQIWDKPYQAKQPGTLKVNPLQGKYYHYFIHEIAAKLNRGQSPIICIVGNTGTGKSEAALRLTEILYDELNLFKGEFSDDQLVYNVIPFLKKVRDIPVPDPEDHVNPDREVLIFEEAEVNLNVIDHHDDFNRAVDEVLNTMRIKNCAYIFVAPQFSDIDSRIQKNTDYLIAKESTTQAQPILREKDNTAMQKKDAVNNLYVDGKWYPDRPSEKYREDYHEEDFKHKQHTIEERTEEMERKKKKEEEERRRRNTGSDLSELID